MSAALLAAAVVAGLLIGLSLGALGGGGSVLAVPVLVYLLGQTPAQATTGSLVVVGLTALVGAVAAYRQGTLLLGRGLAFGATAIGGAAIGARAATHVPDAVLMTSFSLLLVVVAAVMVQRQVLARRDGSPQPRPYVDDPIISFSPTFTCACPRALTVLVSATAVGLLTGFLGVGGGFLVVPALVLALGLPMDRAAGTSLVVIALTSVVALTVRAGSGVQPDWVLVAVLSGVAVTGGWLGTRLACRVSTARLQSAFTALVLVVAAVTAVRAVPALT